VEPIHAWAYGLARHIPEAHELLALVDSIRVGRARDRRLAQECLHELLVGT